MANAPGTKIIKLVKHFFLNLINTKNIKQKNYVLKNQTAEVNYYV